MKRPLDKNPPSGRPRISRKIIVDTALAMMRENPGKGLSLSEIARRLNVTTMALYRHVEDKKELEYILAVKIIKKQFRNIEGSKKGDWKTSLRKYLGNVLDILKSNPIILHAITDSRFGISEEILEMMEKINNYLTECGMPPENRALAQHILWYYTVGISFSLADSGSSQSEFFEKFLFKMENDNKFVEKYPHTAESLAASQNGDGINHEASINFLIDLFAEDRQSVSRKSASERRKASIRKQPSSQKDDPLP
ncbi:MAG: TetR/AcrR family transcriptional regulator [Sphingobium sp.]